MGNDDKRDPPRTFRLKRLTYEDRIREHRSTAAHRIVGAKYYVLACHPDGRLVIISPDKKKGVPFGSYQAAKLRADLCHRKQPHSPDGDVAYVVLPVVTAPTIKSLRALDDHPDRFATLDEADEPVPGNTGRFRPEPKSGDEHE